MFINGRLNWNKRDKFWSFFLCVCRGVWDAARPAGAGRSCDVGVPLPPFLLPVSSGPKDGHASRRRSDPGEARRQEDPPRLPADDHKTGKRHHRHQQLEERGLGGLGWTLYIQRCDVYRRWKTHSETIQFHAATERFFTVQIHIMDCSISAPNQRALPGFTFSPLFFILLWVLSKNVKPFFFLILSSCEWLQCCSLTTKRRHHIPEVDALVCVKAERDSAFCVCVPTPTHPPTQPAWQGCTFHRERGLLCGSGRLNRLVRCLFVRGRKNKNNKK